MTKPDAGYGFELCAANDPKRTHCYLGEVKQWIIGRYALATHHRKLIELPAELKDEWRVVGGDEVLTERDMCISDGEFKDQSWFKYLNRQWTPNQVKNYPQPSPELFIRRKSQPVSAVESGAEFGRWISVDERLPKSGEAVLLSDSIRPSVPAVGMYDGRTYRVEWVNDEFTHVTHWMPLPNPPAPEKTDAELAWEEHSNGESCDGAADLKDAFLAGYAKGAAK